jgi:hypothetical protein
MKMSHRESKSSEAPITDAELRRVLRLVVARLRAVEARVAEIEERAAAAEFRWP